MATRGENSSVGSSTLPELNRRDMLRLGGAAVFLPRAAEIFTPEHEATSNSLITVKNGQFFQHGRPVGFIGENWYSLGEDDTSADNMICSPILSPTQRKQWTKNAASLGMNLMRFWAFPELTANGKDMSAIDQVLTLGAHNGIQAYLTLENNFPNCVGDTKQKTIDWYAEGYKTTYLPYVKRMTEKYKEDARIFGFQLINEAQCDEPGVLRNFAYDVLNVVKDIDPHRLVSLGVIGVDQPGVVGDNFKRLLTPRNGKDHQFDFSGIDLWPGSETGSYKGLPGDSENGIWTRIQEAAKRGMPTLITEQGRARANGLTAQQAADLDRPIIHRLLELPTFGGLLGWGLLPPGIPTDGTDYTVNSPEALLLRSFANKIKDPRLR